MMVEYKIWVQKALTEDPSLRDNNEKLYWAYLKHIKYNLDTPIKDFLKDIANKTIPAMDTLARCSRKIQEENPNLVGKKRQKRLEKATKIAREMRDF